MLIRWTGDGHMDNADVMLTWKLYVAAVKGVGQRFIVLGILVTPIKAYHVIGEQSHAEPGRVAGSPPDYRNRRVAARLL